MDKGKVSVLIPSRGEQFMPQTVDDIFEKSGIMKRTRTVISHRPSPNHIDSVRRIEMAEPQYTTDAPQVAGFIYLITNRINGKQYVGQTTKTIEERWLSHVYNAKKGLRYLIHKAIRKYGPDNFIVSELAQASSTESLNELEASHIKSYNTIVPNGYNLDSGGKNCLKHTDTKIKISLAKKGKPSPRKGTKMSSESKVKLSAALRGKPSWWKGKSRSNETRAKMSIARKGKKGTPHTEEFKSRLAIASKGNKYGCGPMSEEHKAKISEAHKGKRISDEHRAAISATLRGRPSTKKGISLSEETKSKISVALKGRASPLKGRTLSDETRSKISMALMGNKNGTGNTYWTGKKHSSETKAKMSIAGKRRIVSEETRAKISIALTGRPSTQKGIVRSEETKAKMSAAAMGRPSPRKGVTLSDETKAKIGIAHRGKIVSAETRQKLSASHKKGRQNEQGFVADTG